ncbi:hypothetical protein EB118_14735 [bacterium]|nr:hypothetical protein [bacterium]NDC95232.1 hypothetical protein [bacterium]NDD84983.1 hypothetical protein [bacterium]NDG31313.1 hypothetical protein [bacterium]
MLPPTLNYIGSKLLLVDWIKSVMTEYMQKPLERVSSFWDPFAGTGVVTLMAIRSRIPRVMTNDIQYFSYVMSSVWTTRDIDVVKLRTHCDILNTQLQSGVGLVGYITKTYATERGYFTQENARKIDYMRQLIQIKYASGDYTYNEFKMMLKLLLYASVSVANVSSTFGAYLKQFKKSAKRPITIDAGILGTLVDAPEIEHISNQRNVLDLYINAEVVYIDSPYNRRRYDKNYFVLEAIAKYNNSEAKGKTGVLMDTDPANLLFCSPLTVTESFTKLLRNIYCKYLFISYSTESLLSRTELEEILRKCGYMDITIKQCVQRRFKSHLNVDREVVIEYIFCARKMDNLDS